MCTTASVWAGASNGRCLVDFIFANWVLILVALVSGAMLAWPLVNRGGASTITPLAAVQLINRERAAVVDVRTPEEFATGHVVGAKNVPLEELEKKLPAAAKNKGNPLVLVCATGARSARAVPVARKLGYEQAQSLAGGLKSWREADLPTESA